ncbi:metallophosphoesterase family protein [Spirosoma flavum]|uniref:Metallophosphoesterase family protein n=1 Tax=Spirosoma flavum TaxID=2048557 RepID=A0ABW6AJ72_9BACT
MLFTEKFAADLDERQQKLTLAQPQSGMLDSAIWVHLTDSENLFIQLMSGTPPPPDALGNLEQGWCLFFLNGKMPNVPLAIQLILVRLHPILHLLGMPPTKITTTQWNSWLAQLNGVGVLTGDGTLVSTALYAQVDPGWALSLLDYFLVQLNWINKVAFNPNGQQIQVSNKSTLQVALFSDWGTGAYQDGHLSGSPAQLVMQQIKSQAPDMVIHLGDVYYSGTYGLFGAKTGEEYTKLVTQWTYQAPLGNFTLNSNHEMYDGGNGLFNVALNSSITSLFQAQGNASFFSISFGNWLILGLDSAYYADAKTMYMTGAILDPAQQQLLQQAGTSGKKIMILTHHNPINEIGTIQNELWTDVVSHLGKNPDYWYWGHVHNGIVYSETSVAGRVCCRCVGNGAIPIGQASWFANNSAISFYTNSPLGDTAPRNALRIKNGFAHLTFAMDTVQEQWFYQDGSLAWSSSGA